VNNIAETQKRITLAELREKTAKAIKSATTFEKSPVFDMQIGTEVLFRVKKVIAGKYPEPLVIASELRVGVGSGDDTKFPPTVTTLKAYLQDGKDGPRTYVEIKPGEEVRVPSFVVRRAQENGVTLHSNQVYWASFIEGKEVERGTFKVCAVALVGAEFPEA